MALPDMETQLHASFDAVLWVLNGYTLTASVLLITAGRLGDMLGPRRLFLLGLLLFTAASAACGLARDVEWLIASRLVQGLGAALLTPQTLALVVTVFPPERRGAAFGVWGSVAGLAAITGPCLGGALVTAFGWPSIFVINIPLGLAGIVAGVLLLPEVRSHRSHDLDLPGVTLATAGLFCVVYALVESQPHDWGPILQWGAFSIGTTRWSPISIDGLLVYGVLFLVAFLLWERRASEPLLPLSLFADRAFSLGSLVLVATTVVVIGVTLTLSIFLQSVAGMNAVETGLTLLPSPLALLVASLVSGRLSDSIGVGYLATGGALMATVGVLLVSHGLSASQSRAALVIPLLVLGLGMGCVFPPITARVMHDVRPSLNGAASGFIATNRQVTIALASALVTSILTNRVAADLPETGIRLARRLPPPVRNRFVSSLVSVSAHAQHFGAHQTVDVTGATGLPHGVAVRMAALAHEAFADAFLTAARDALALILGAVLVGALTSALLPGIGQGEEAKCEEKESSVELAG